MTTKTMEESNPHALGRVEKSGLIVTAVIVAANVILGFQELAFGAGAGGILVTVSFISTKFLVSALIGGVHSKGFSIFILLIKLTVLIGIVVSLFAFTTINIYGFLIGVTGVVIVLVGENLRGSRNGTL